MRSRGIAARISRLLPRCPRLFKPLHNLLYVSKELAYGGAKGGHSVSVGVRNSLLTKRICRVSRQDIDLIREAPKALMYHSNMARAHHEHEVSLFKYPLAYLSCAVTLSVDPD